MSLLKVSLLNREKTQVGQPFTDITLNTPDGKKLSVSEVARGCKVTLIDFWASWCGPCRREMPNVKAVYEKYHSKGFDVIGVSLDFKEDAWKKAIVDMDLKWPQISDIKGFDSEGAILYGVDAIPATILIKDGIIVGRNLYEEALGEKVAELLGE
jgi:thiol-disulfide isomerase/thioredoxin